MAFDDIVELVASAAGRAGVATPAVRLEPHVPGLARAEPAGRGAARVIVGPQILNGPEQAQRFVSFHEVAHIALGHTRGQSVQAFSLIAAAVATGLWVLARPGDYILAMAVLCPFAISLFLMAMAQRRGREFAADRLAAALGAPLTPDVSAFLADHQPTWAKRTPWWYRDHPTPERRLAREVRGSHRFASAPTASPSYDGSS